MYVMTHTSIHKMQEININQNVTICKNLMQAWGIGEKFIAFYDLHVNEDDSGWCILKISLTQAIVFNEEAIYNDVYPHISKIKQLGYWGIICIMGAISTIYNVYRIVGDFHSEMVKNYVINENTEIIDIKENNNQEDFMDKNIY